MLHVLRFVLINLLFISGVQAADFNVTTPGDVFSYTINGNGGNPALTLERGRTYTFNINTCSCHPFEIRGAPVGSVTNNNISSGTITFAVPATAVNYSYRCSIHLFSGTITTIAAASAPTVTTSAATAITGVSATLPASVTPNGAATTVFFDYSTDPALLTGVTTLSTTAGSGSTSVSSSVSATGLQPGTQYFYRARASNTAGSTDGSILSFTTLSHDASLAALTVSAGTLAPVFDAATLAYTLTVQASSLTVTPTAAQSGAVIKVNNLTVASGAASSALPLEGGVNTVTIDVTAPDTLGKQTYVLTVTSDVPEIEVESPLGIANGGGKSGLVLGPVAVGGNSTRTFLIKNAGTQNLTGLSTSIDGVAGGDFAVLSTLPASIAPGGSFGCEVKFTPAAEGSRSAVLHLTSNDGNESPFNIALLGNTHRVDFDTKTITQREDAVVVTIPVRLSVALGRAWTLPINFTGTAGVADCTHTVSPLKFTAAQTVANIVLTIKEDLLLEGDETIIMTLGAPSDAAVSALSYGLSVAGDIVSTANQATLTISEDDVLPVINPGPASQTVHVGDPVVFSGAVSQGSAPITLQWKKNNVAIAGATANALNIPAAALTDGAAYTFAATNQRGTATSVAQLAVVDNSAHIVRANVGTSPVMTVGATGNTLTYRWRKGGSDLNNDAKYANVTTKTLTVKKVISTDSGSFTCMVTGPGGSKESGAFDLQVPSLVPIADTPAFPDVTVYNSFQYQLTFNDAAARAPTKFVCAGLPKGLVCNAATGLITGKPTVTGSFPVDVTLSNSAGNGDVVHDTFSVVAFPSGATGSYVGVIGRDGVANSNLGGRIDLKTTSAGGFTGTLRLGAEAFALNSSMVTAPSVNAHPGVEMTIPRSRRLPVVLTLDLNPLNNDLIGSVREQGSATSAGITGWRSVWHSTAPANLVSAQLGAHSFRIDPAATGPEGFGYGTISVTNLGVTSVAGRTGDGGVILAGGTLGPAGEVPLFQLLYANKGSVLGVIDIASDLNHSINSPLNWQKTAITTAREHQPFGPLTVTAVGGKYSPSAPVLGLSPSDIGIANCNFDFSNGGLGASATNPDAAVRITTTNAISIVASNPGAISSLALSAATGSFTGKFTLFDAPAAPRTVTFQGWLVPTEGRGYGYFLMPQLANPSAVPPTTATTSPILSGKVILGP